MHIYINVLGGLALNPLHIMLPFELVHLHTPFINFSIQFKSIVASTAVIFEVEFIFNFSHCIVVGYFLFEPFLGNRAPW